MDQLPGDTFQSAVLNMLDSEELADVTFIIGESKERVSAHKFVLALRSSVFKAMFNSTWDSRSQKAEIEIPDTDEPTFRSFLKVIAIANRGFIK